MLKEAYLPSPLIPSEDLIAFHFYCTELIISVICIKFRLNHCFTYTDGKSLLVFFTFLTESSIPGLHKSCLIGERLVYINGILGAR